MSQEKLQQSRESSLFAPEDRDRSNKWKPDQFEPSLTNDELNSALKDLNVNNLYRKIDRTYADPPVNLQNFGLFSFIPAKGATPNEHGSYGYAKLRGNFASAMEANQHAERIVKDVDSYHQIFHTYVGRPFPLTNSSKYSAETEEVDLNKQISKDLSNDVKNKRIEDKREIQKIQERHDNLQKEVDREAADPYENYITLRVKKAQLTWTYLEHQKKMVEVKEFIIKARKDIEELEVEHSDYKDTYYQKYMDARKDAGIKDDANSKDNFIKFMVEDADLGF